MKLFLRQVLQMTLGADSLDTVELIMELKKSSIFKYQMTKQKNIVSVGQAIEFIEKSK